MVFNSMAELESHVLSVMSNCARLCANDMLEIMRQEIENAYSSYSPSMYDRTGDLRNTPQLLYADNKGMGTEFMDNGGWYSLVGRTEGQHFFALEGLEGGYSWGRGATNIFGNSLTRCYVEIPNRYKEYMRAFGIPIV